MSAFFCAELSCVSSGVATGRSRVQRVLTKRPKIDSYFPGVKTSARGPNPKLLIYIFRCFVVTILVRGLRILRNET
jgi:hypothetical protein